MAEPKMRRTADIDWPYSLLDQIIEENDALQIFTGTRDQLDGLQYALSTLYEREYVVLLKRYRDGETLVEVGKDYGVTQERIRQIEAKALRKLRHPQRMKYIVNGLYGEEKRLADEKYRMAHELAEAKAAEEAAGMESAPKTCLNIEELDLSVRSYNCLKRARVNTVADIVSLDLDALHRIRNLGNRSCEEIINKIHGLGLRGKFDEGVSEVLDGTD